MKIRKAIFPVAGFGTRFLPVTKSQPKEMLPIVDKPIIHYLVEEAVASGIEEIILITGRGKKAIEDYFDQSFELEYNLVEKGKHQLLQAIREIPNLARFVYLRQPIPRGDGHAILCARDLIGDEPCAVIYGDDLVDSEIPALAQLLEVYNQTNQPVIGLTKVAPTDVSSYGIVETSDHNNLLQIKSLIEKPEQEDAPSNLAVIGKYILTPQIFEILAKVEEGSVGDGEIRLADAFIIALKHNYPLYGKLIDGKRYDAGSKIGFLKATIDFALKRPELATELRAHLKNIDL
ncbi:UTP--glucose-1-phosphate uridylyltransferase [Candidatus Peregrinibacteria bacterium CG11_big_fil_rev_8_21_14_0_20_41_10]|nr:MAG: UTP--glucose-1-phosphate uridylyltransferase [Candidatus Peregrinibacteria bacterium CG11_big_fil_rev_8_21_14_0_20_41_10]PIZ73128.1 MAG: UTP--glucose-1-phosphate uridylyltransferase [Candidatus Peregrinibacteria bacterium CG_4_10_14_0_2_um_filter_41_8]PJC37677.1 MAG: UTP--glucose-1-phosphate uridylyltransferase [Candidatus Peregrinibacteria bacterium CG_4_9_14_0_2_um_filter_41_14]